MDIKQSWKKSFHLSQIMCFCLYNIFSTLISEKLSYAWLSPGTVMTVMLVAVMFWRNLKVSHSFSYQVQRAAAQSQGACSIVCSRTLVYLPFTSGRK